MKKLEWLAGFLSMLFVVASGCGDDDDDNTGTDADTDTDIDTDSDTDTDSDSDSDTDADTDTDTDSDTDTDGDEIIPGENPFEINCDGGVPFDWGDQTITQYSSFNLEQTNLDYIWDRTWEDEVMTATSYEQYGDGQLLYEFNRVYTYDDNGMLTNLEWEYDYEGAHKHYWLNFIYDDEQRLIEAVDEFETDDSGVIELYYRYTYTYNEDGSVAQYLEEFGPPYESKRGYNYEYDENGKAISATHLDPENDWAETDVLDLYSYDELGRVSEISYGDDRTEVFNYKGDTPQIVSVDNPYGSHWTTFEWEGHTLKRTEYWFSQLLYVLVIEFTEDGNSSFLGMFPSPTSQWIRMYYGLGYINGCNDLGK